MLYLRVAWNEDDYDAKFNMHCTFALSIALGVSVVLQATLLECVIRYFHVLIMASICPGRMESTGEGGKIHMSKAAALLICEQDPSMRTFVQPRGEPIKVKGKGTMSTYWLRRGADFQVSLNNKTHPHVCRPFVLAP